LDEVSVNPRSEFTTIPDGKSNYMYSLNDEPFGKSWEHWTTEWWKWILSLPKEVNPGIDKTGEKLHIDPKGESVVFLPGTFGGNAERHYTIPKKPILLPVINFITSFYEEPQIKTEFGLVDRAKKDIDDITLTWAIVDGLSIPVKDFRVRSSIFDLNIVEDNVFGIKVGVTRAVHDGYWLFLRPLSAGKHVIQVFGSCSSGKTKIGVVFHLGVYNDREE
jgi:hypothetical protein